MCRAPVGSDTFSSASPTSPLMLLARLVALGTPHTLPRGFIGAPNCGVCDEYFIYSFCAAKLCCKTAFVLRSTDCMANSFAVMLMLIARLNIEHLCTGAVARAAPVPVRHAVLWWVRWVTSRARA